MSPLIRERIRVLLEKKKKVTVRRVHYVDKGARFLAQVKWSLGKVNLVSFNILLTAWNIGGLGPFYRLDRSEAAPLKWLYLTSFKNSWSHSLQDPVVLNHDPHGLQPTSALKQHFGSRPETEIRAPAVRTPHPTTRTTRGQAPVTRPWLISCVGMNYHKTMKIVKQVKCLLGGNE